VIDLVHFPYVNKLAGKDDPVGDEQQKQYEAQGKNGDKPLTLITMHNVRERGHHNRFAPLLVWPIYVN
jgi:hypothetical protein